MVIEIQSLLEIGQQFDAIVFDQWGVLHDGSVPYVGVPKALENLADAGLRLAVLSNSGKRAAANAERITAKGYRADLFDAVMTSGEALWRDLKAQRLGHFRRLFAVASANGDAEGWIAGLDDFSLVDRIDDADAVLLMGMSEQTEALNVHQMLEKAKARNMPVLCSNPDHASPRAGGKIVTSVGALARDYERAGGHVLYYGKPHRSVFDALVRVLEAEPSRLLMVGDSLDHDIAGAHAAGWRTAFVQGGLHAKRFDGGNAIPVIQSLAEEKGTPAPDYTLFLAR